MTDCHAPRARLHLLIGWVTLLGPAARAQPEPQNLPEINLAQALAAAAKVIETDSVIDGWRYLESVRGALENSFGLRLRRGEYALQGWLASSTPNGLRGALLTAARRDFAAATKLSPGEPAPRRRLVELAYHTAPARQAYAEANALLEWTRTRSLGAEPTQAIQRIHALASARFAVDAKTNPESAPPNNPKYPTERARTGFEALEEQKALDVECLQAWSALERTMGKPKAAVAVLDRAVVRDPFNQQVLSTFIDVARVTKQSTIAIDRLVFTDSVTLWFRAQAYMHRAFEPDVAANSDQQQHLLVRSMDCFEACAASGQRFRKACDEWQSVVFGCNGYLWLARGRLPLAANQFLAAADKDPSRIDRATLRGRSVLDGILAVVRAHEAKQDAPAGRQVLAQATHYFPHPELLTQQGIREMSAGRTAQSKDAAGDHFKTAQDAFAKAIAADSDRLQPRVELSRLRLHHLHTDLAGVPAELSHCIEGAEVKLAELETLERKPKDVRRQTTMRTVLGDAHQALGYYWMAEGNDPGKAKTHLTKCLAVSPAGREQAKEWLRKLED